MNRSKPTSVLIATASLAISVSVWAAGDVATGKLEYEAKCVACHGVTGLGDGPFTNQLKIPSTDLTLLAKNNGGAFPTAKVLAVLDGRSEVQAHGPRDMPIYGEIYLAEGPADKIAKEREPYVSARLRALVAYLEAIQSEAPLAKDQVALGKLEYEAKCIACHGISGKGDGPFTSQLKIPSTDLTQLAKKNGGVFPVAHVLAGLDGRSQVQAHGPRDMPIYGEVYLAEGPKDTTAKEREPFVDARIRALISYLETLQQ